MNPVNVLVVDDFPQNLIASEAMLARPGLNVMKASSGVEALELLLKHDVALALIDVQMPEMDGFELAEIIRGNKRTSMIPIIFLTAAPEEATRSFRGYQAGAVDFLTKPIAPDVLRGKVEVFVQLHVQKEQIREQVEELRQSLQMNELFIAVLGHDLRTPLSAVLHGAELIERIASEPKVGEMAVRIRSSGERMERMVRQLLDVAHVRSGNLTLFKGKANYKDICQRILEEIEHSATASRISLDCKGDLEGLFDADRISQVVSNLVGNALQHGSPTGNVRLVLDGSTPGRVMLSVANEGSMPPGALESIFKPFHMQHDRRTSSAGLGLGLYIVKQFVEAHEGEVSVRSNVDEGTVFEVSLPRGAV